MSYDFWIEIEASDGSDPVCVDPLFSDQHPQLQSDGLAGTAILTPEGFGRCGNYTSNVAPIWSRCLRSVARDCGRPGGLRLADLSGERCALAAPFLAAAVEWGATHLDQLRPLNPENRWGNAEGAITYLWDIQRMCEAHPKATLRISS